MSPRIEIVGGAGEYEAAAIAAAVQAVLAEAEAKARRPSTTSQWRLELEAFTPVSWSVRPGGGDTPPNSPR